MRKIKPSILEQLEAEGYDNFHSLYPETVYFPAGIIKTTNKYSNHKNNYHPPKKD